MADQAEFNALDAEYLLNHPVLVGAFNKLREDYVAILEEGPTDTATRDGIMIGLQVLKSIRQNIQDHIENAAVDKQRKEFKSEEM